MKLFQSKREGPYGTWTKTWRIRIEWKYQDFWIGAFWKTDRHKLDFDLWICLLPCLPIHLWWTKEFRRNGVRIGQAPQPNSQP